MVATILGVDDKHRHLSEAANLVTQGQVKGFCVSLYGNNGVCMDTFINKISELPAASMIIPPGLKPLLRSGCNYVVTGEGLDNLIPHLPTMLSVVGQILGFPSSTCGVELTNVITSQIEDGFNPAEMCAGMSYGCVRETVSGLKSLPFFRDYIPDGTSELLAATCNVLGNPLIGSEATAGSFESILEELPTLMNLLGKVLIGPHAGLSEQCMKESQSHLFTPEGNFDGIKLCSLESTCKDSIYKGLKKLPIAGKYIPDEIVEMEKALCSLFGSMGSGKLDPSKLVSVLPQLLNTFLKIFGLSENCATQLDVFVNSGNVLTNGDFNVQGLCRAVDGACMVEMGVTAEKCL